MEVTIPREKEWKQINLFNSCLTKLPLRIKQLITTQEMQWLLPILKKMLVVKQTDEEMSSLEATLQIPTGKKICLSILKNMSLNRLGDEDLEKMEEKWNELNDTQAFYQWFFKQYRQEFEDLFYNDCHGSRIEFRRYVEDLFLKLDFHTILWSEEVAKNCCEAVRKYREEYDAYLESISNKGHCLYLYNKDDEKYNEKLLAFQIYYQLTEGYFNNLFQLMQNRESQLVPEDYRLIYNLLREKGIDRYVQQRYDEYRSLMPGATNLRFSYTPQAEEVYQALGKYINTEHPREETLCYLHDLIDKVLPGLTNRNQATGLIRILWIDDKHFSKDKKGNKKINNDFARFRDEVVKAFHLTHLGNFKDYTLGQSQLLRSSIALWEKHQELFQGVVTQDAVTGKISAQTLQKNHNISSKE